MKGKILIFGLMLLVIIGLVNADETRLKTLCSFTNSTVGGKCNDATPDVAFNYTSGTCSTANVSVWCVNASGVGESWEGYGIAWKTATGNDTTFTLNHSLANDRLWSCKLNLSCGSTNIESIGITVSVYTTALTLSDPWLNETDDIVNNASQLYFCVNMTGSNSDTIYFNTSVGSTILTATCSAGVCCGNSSLVKMGGNVVEGANDIYAVGNTTYGKYTVTGKNITVDNKAPGVNIALRVNDTDGVLQQNETKSWWIEVSDPYMFKVSIGGYNLFNSTNATMFRIQNTTATLLAPHCVWNCTYCTVNVSAWDKAGNLNTTSNASITIFPCIESHNYGPINITSVSATHDTLTIVYAQDGNTKTVVYMMEVVYNGSHRMCPYKASNVNYTFVNIGPRPNATGFCNVTLNKTKGNTGTVVIQESREVSIRPPRQVLPIAVSLIIGAICFGAGYIVHKKKSEQ